MSYTLNLQHIVFGTKFRKPTISMLNCNALYSYIWSMLQKRNCKLYRIGGVEDHVHMLVNVHPSVSIAELMKEIKSYSSQWMKKSSLFPYFEGWGQGYFAHSVDHSSKLRIIHYVMNQVEHHRGEAYVAELERLYRENGGEWHNQELC